MNQPGMTNRKIKREERRRAKERRRWDRQMAAHKAKVKAARAFAPPPFHPRPSIHFPILGGLLELLASPPKGNL